MKKYCLFALLLMTGLTNHSQTKKSSDLDVIQKHFNNLKKKSKNVANDFSEWKVSSSASSLKKGLTHYYLTQYYRGIPIVNGTYNMSVFNGKVNFTNNLGTSNNRQTMASKDLCMTDPASHADVNAGKSRSFNNY